MVDRITSRPLAHLAVLTFMTLFIASQTGARAQLPNAETAAPAEVLDPQFVIALLTPMSRLIESPYSDPTAVENPLRLQQRSTLSAAVAQSITSKPDAVPTTAASADVLKVDAENPLHKIQLASEFLEETLPALGTALPQVTPLPPTAAFAMSGR